LSRGAIQRHERCQRHTFSYDQSENKQPRPHDSDRSGYRSHRTRRSREGYEIEKNRYVIVTQDELDAVKLETTHTLDIERFVEATDIDRLFWNDPYYLVPDDKSGIEAYTVIRDALEKTKASRDAHA